MISVRNSQLGNFGTKAVAADRAHSIVAVSVGSVIIFDAIVFYQLHCGI
jgi:hypothetical protein